MSADLTGALTLGLLLGIRHALDPDHVVAVSTIVSEYRNFWRAIWVGISWGLGHTTSLFIVGLFIIGLRLAIPERLALFFEFGVGLLLVVLGLQVLQSYWRKRIHQHPHLHQKQVHHHFHSHEEDPGHAHKGLPLIGRPFFRFKSYAVGTVHGLAGSAALMLLVLTAIGSPLGGIFYILLFGLGSIGAMGVITMLIGLPFVASARFPAFNRTIQAVTGVASVAFGSLLMYEIGFTEGLFRAAS